MAEKAIGVSSATLAIRVQPGAKSNEVVGWIADGQAAPSLKIRLRAAAVEGQANAALREFLAEILGMRGRQITLLQGEKSRQKLVRIDGLTLQEIEMRIGKETLG